MKAPFVDPRLCFMPYPRYDIIVCSDEYTETDGDIAIDA